MKLTDIPRSRTKAELLQFFQESGKIPRPDNAEVGDVVQIGSLPSPHRQISMWEPSPDPKVAGMTLFCGVKLSETEHKITSVLIHIKPDEPI